MFKNVTRWHDEQQQLVFKNMLPLTFCLKIPVFQNGEVDMQVLNKELKLFKQTYKLLAKSEI